MAHQFGGIAMVHERRGNLILAVENSLKAAALFQDLGDRQGEARALGNAGSYCLRSGRTTEGIDCLVHSLEIAAAIGDPSVLNVALRNLGTIVGASAAPQSDIACATSLLEGFRQGRNLYAAELRHILRRLAASSRITP